MESNNRLLYAPSPHAAERNRAARRVWWLGLFLIVSGALQFAAVAAYYVSVVRAPYTADALDGILARVAPWVLRGVLTSLLIGVAGAGMVAAAPIIRCGKRWAYAAAFAVAVTTMVRAARYLPSFFPLMSHLIFDPEGLMQNWDFYWMWTVFGSIWSYVSVFFDSLALFPAMLAGRAVSRLYRTERRAERHAKASAARRNRERIL